jgi:polyisoprenyl-phosphate glycosyltransferase
MSRPTRPLISVIVPCFNEEESLPILFERLESVADTWNIRHEVVCVDDGSTDSTWELLQKQAATHPHWRSYSFSRNFGHQSAVSAGLAKSLGDAVIIIDADLQDPPEELVRFIAEWQAGYDVVYGVRESREDPAIKQALAWTFYRLLEKFATIHIPRDSGDFALLDRKVVNVINRLPEHNRYLRGLRSWVGFRQRALVFKRVGRVAGQPHYTFGASLKLAVDGFFSFSTVPLRMATYIGAALLIFTLPAMLLSLCKQGFAPESGLLASIPLPSPLAAALVILGGVQLICTGILGEYLGRIYEEVQARPGWIINESTDNKG